MKVQSSFDVTNKGERYCIFIIGPVCLTVAGKTDAAPLRKRKSAPQFQTEGLAATTGGLQVGTTRNPFGIADNLTGLKKQLLRSGVKPPLPAHSAGCWSRRTSIDPSPDMFVQVLLNSTTLQWASPTTGAGIDEMLWQRVRSAMLNATTYTYMAYHSATALPPKRANLLPPQQNDDSIPTRSSLDSDRHLQKLCWDP